MEARTLTSKDPGRQFEDEGYVVVRSLFSAAEVAAIGEHFMQVRAEGPKPGDMGGDPGAGAADPLNRFARMLNMHDWDQTSLELQRDERFAKTASRLIGDDVALCQTMLYFKPPGARGQALHQDHQYLRRYPVIAAWLALDDCDQDNGQMVVIPGSHRAGILPVRPADTQISFTDGESLIPEGSAPCGLAMQAGDALFFGGFTIHGSFPNCTADRFRRAFIVHYYGAHTRELPYDPRTMMSELAGAA
ncbi:MAG TPA: phytanoyl-CoA dioxygenase family protein [Polyangiaceae bacterium]|jgi:ectoine hydroxylase-related dioxygenase (phytanoyl-CoA dioxygenase family)